MQRLTRHVSVIEDESQAPKHSHVCIISISTVLSLSIKLQKREERIP